MTVAGATLKKFRRKRWFAYYILRARRRNCQGF
jgi:hypothetical protein